ncbi:elongation factor 1-beta [Candidatus Woesearchaeota archaeon]|nr:elongation factor 1-beta [Candidatus Woesearchaeota archaeon]
MAKAIITMKIMPEDPGQDLDRITKEAEEKIKSYAGDTEHKVERQPIAFGLIAVIIKFVVDEAKGGTEDVEKEITSVEGVNSVEVIDVRRIIG